MLFIKQVNIHIINAKSHKTLGKWRKIYRTSGPQLIAAFNTGQCSCISQSALLFSSKHLVKATVILLKSKN